MTLNQTKKFILARVKQWRGDGVRVVSSPIVARIRRLAQRWTAEEDQEMEVWVEPSAEKLLKKILNARIRAAKRKARTEKLLKKILNARIRAAKRKARRQP